MNGCIYLIGGGEIAKGETQIIDNDIKKSAPRNSSFIFFPTAAGDSYGYIETITSVFGEYFNVSAITKEKGRACAENAIRTATVVYLGGGKTKPLLDLFEKWGLVDFLRQALERGVNIAGMSAGAQALSTWYVHEGDNSMELRRGWGFVPVCLLVHTKEESIKKAKTLWQKNDDAKHYDFLAISEGTAWRIGVSDKSKIGSGKVWIEPRISS